MRPDDEQIRSEHFTDEELAFLRFARFGELPPRADPEGLVETVETEQPPLPGRRVFDLGAEGPHIG
jgi:hypothetical protein